MLLTAACFENYGNYGMGGHKPQVGNAFFQSDVKCLPDSLRALRCVCKLGAGTRVALWDIGSMFRALPLVNKGRRETKTEEETRFY